MPKPRAMEDFMSANCSSSSSTHACNSSTWICLSASAPSVRCVATATALA
eukprot:CAMPEP_0119115512 /NCGR_PEP_ID=MMETSP1180-20130426/51209_1 /TAXON_ID=3052 ORGANISM="Chlamydomonas cf sp, Strain CCMP681" /NCGR_SAMPLE_ID=MMETSP1180 /ASSEMBLY_ACC=CAM_ASM_000741 /LENGTH=49 /DNA_ID= /DNA_START= /DNA_END= /DNA_ORIENTATION=